LRIVQQQKPSTRLTLEEPHLNVASVAFSPEGKVLALGCQEMGLLFWDWSRGRLTAKGGRSPR
jgi:hypothetical protein